jgi:hypothetical protein
MVEHPAVNGNVVGSSPTCRALDLVANLSDRPVNEEPRCREVAGFLRFPVDPQGFTRWCPPDRSAERALRQTARGPLFHSGRVSGEELSDSLPQNIDPVNNPIAFAPPKATLHLANPNLSPGLAC